MNLYFIKFLNEFVFRFLHLKKKRLFNLYLFINVYMNACIIIIIIKHTFMVLHYYLNFI